jgi:Sulfotransferase family
MTKIIASKKKFVFSSFHRNSFVIFTTACITWSIASFMHAWSHEKSSDTKKLPVFRNDMSAQLRRQERQFTQKNSSKTISKRDQYDGPSTAYRKYQYPFPCVEGEENLMVETPSSEGLLFQRPHKTGSTTMVGILLRLSHHRAKGFKRCKHRAMHGTARFYEYGKRDRSRSFLFTIIRDPTKRTISQFFHFDVTAFQVEPTDLNFLRMARSSNHNYYLNELTTRQYVPNGTVISNLDFAQSKGYHSVQDLEEAKSRSQPGLHHLLGREYQASNLFGLSYKPDQIIQDILEDFDFISIMERMDESLVVMQMILGLTTKEILYTRARSSGSFSNGWKGRPCFYIMKSFLTPYMKEYFVSEEWNATIANDLRMYQAASKSLDRTIEALGHDQFQKNLDALRRGLELANKNCKGRIRLQCDEGGNQVPPSQQTCYIWSEGCDHECIDELNLE